MKQKFDGLAGDYDRFRPRYPRALFAAVVRTLGDNPTPRVVDTGAGTGVALEGLLPLLPAGAEVTAVDISADMIEQGRAKFPSVAWHVTEAEPFLEGLTGVDLIVAAQAYQWMDRPRYLRAAQRCLAPGGSLAILQNNRDFTVNAFLDAYEELLEDMSPGYSRYYRSFDIAAELRAAFGHVVVERTTWEQPMKADDFVGMSRSSTQAQRAIAAHGDEYTKRLAELIETHESGGEVVVTYTSEAFVSTVPSIGGPGDG